MGSDRPNESALPTAVREGLERLCTQLQETLGEQLESVILYGGLAKGELRQRVSNVNVLVVLKDVTVDALDKAVSPIQQGVRDFGLAVMVLSEDDLRRSTDVFPIKFLDMQQHHNVLYGKDVLVDLPIARDNLRLRCEQEIKNLLLRLRAFYLQRANHSELVESTLSSAISSLLSSLGGVLVLQTGEAPLGERAIVTTACRELGLDESALQDVLALSEGRSQPDAAELKRLYGAFMATVQNAADAVDRL